MCVTGPGSSSPLLAETAGPESSASHSRRGAGRGSGRESGGRGGGRHVFHCSAEAVNCRFQFLVTDWLCRLDTVVPPLLGSPGPNPLANASGAAGLWAQCAEPGCRKRRQCSPFSTPAPKLEFGQSCNSDLTQSPPLDM